MIAADGAGVTEDEVEDPSTPDFTSEDMKNMIELTRALSKSLSKSSSSGESIKVGLDKISSVDERNMESLEGKTLDESGESGGGAFTAEDARNFAEFDPTET